MSPWKSHNVNIILKLSFSNWKFQKFNCSGQNLWKFQFKYNSGYNGQNWSSVMKTKYVRKILNRNCELDMRRIKIWKYYWNCEHLHMIPCTPGRFIINKNIIITRDVLLIKKRIPYVHVYVGSLCWESKHNFIKWNLKAVFSYIIYVCQSFLIDFKFPCTRKTYERVKYMITFMLSTFLLKILKQCMNDSRKSWYWYKNFECVHPHVTGSLIKVEVF